MLCVLLQWPNDEIVEFEKLIESLYVTRSLSNRTQELTTQTNHLREQNEIYSSLSNISLQLYEKLIKYRLQRLTI